MSRRISSTRIEAAAFASAALAPALIGGATFAALGAAPAFALRLAIFALLIALAHVLLLGVPAAWLVRQRHPISWAIAVTMGFVIGALPTGLWAWPLWHTQRGMSASDWNGRALVQTVVNGVPTWAGWMQYLRLLMLAGAFGASGGIAYWWVRRRLLRAAR
ncbi:MAG TPA: hypothetical protein VME21_03575 [Steroidobacteraceae bacterium]|nr:hypothetical protein [Steroidobacteraceae bacterium]